MDALAQNLFERLHVDGISTVYVGDLTEVLSTHWSVEANEKTHNLRIHQPTRLCRRGVRYRRRSPIGGMDFPRVSDCGERDETVRHGDSLWCPCGFEGHADLTASSTFLSRVENEQRKRPMARLVRFEWNDHEWSELPYSPRSKESRTNPQVTCGTSALS
jgi:putative transposase